MDALAQIAESFHIKKDRGLVAPSPIPIADKNLELTMKKTEGVFDIVRETQEDIEAEVARMRETYAPFFRSLAPNPEVQGESKEERIPIQEFTFSLDGGAEEVVTLPHYGGPPQKAKAVYTSTFSLPAYEGKRAILRINGADYIAQVFVNGEFVGGHEGFFAPFELDITEFAVTGNNTLKIILTNDVTMKDGGDKIYAATGLGWDDAYSGWHHCPPGIGLYHSVYVSLREQEFITDLFPRVNSNASEVWVDCDSAGYEEKDVKFAVSVYGENFEETVFEDKEYVPTTVMEAGMSDTYTESLLNAKGILGVGQPLKLMNSFNRFKVPMEIPNARQWTPDEPYLYRVVVKLIVNGEIKSVRSKTFGVRDFTQDMESTPKGKFYLNGKEIALRGANTMGFEQQDVFRGDIEQLIWDMLLAKVCNMNFLRLTQRPVQDEVYDICDRVGLMIQTDLPLFGVIRIHKYHEVLRQAGEMERIVRSHPCCILCTYINEPFPNANNQPHRNITRKELQQFFVAADDILHMENPDRVIKHVDGDYDPPDAGLPDNHCYNMWYNGHGLEMGDMHKGYWIPVKPGWHCGCGEFGSEGLDFVSTMKKHYPKDWLEGEFHPSKIIKSQILAFHRHFYETTTGVENWVRESHEYQAFATKLITSSFRRNPLMNTFAIHLFIDAFPSGWMKTIVDCERNMKPAFFEYRRCLAPIFCHIRSDRFTYFGGEQLELETYLCRDEGYQVTELRYYVMAGEKLLASEVTTPIDGMSQGRITMPLPIVDAKERITVYIGAFDGEKCVAWNEESYTIYPEEKLQSCEFVDYSEYEANRTLYDARVKAGEVVRVHNLPRGIIRIGDAQIEVKMPAMNPIYFAARDTGSPYVEGIEKNEFRWFYDDKEDKLMPLLYETFQVKADNGDEESGIKPIMRTTNKNANGVWEDAFACAELSYGKGRFIISALKLEHKTKNPVVVKFLNQLARE